MYKFPKFSKNKVKQAFLNAGGWRIITESDCMLELMPYGYKAKDGFTFLFVKNEEESKEYDMPIGEAYHIDVYPWVAVDRLTAEDFDNLNQIVDTANACVKEYGKRYKY
jgi:phenylalanyl-tRNA synthetase beta subunit